jgi:hypothetical protein
MQNLKRIVKAGGILLGVIGIVILVVGLIDIIKSHLVITGVIVALELIGAGAYFFADKFLEN